MTTAASPQPPADLRPEPNLGPALDFLRLIWAVDHGLQRMSKWMEQWMGITGPQRLVIRIVGKFPEISAGHLAAVLHIHPSTLTGILKRLEARGLVTRRIDGRDARRSLIALSDKGSHLDVESEGTIEATVNGIISRLPEAQSDVVRTALRDLAEALSGGADRPPPTLPAAPPQRPAGRKRGPKAKTKPGGKPGSPAGKAGLRMLTK